MKQLSNRMIRYNNEFAKELSEIIRTDLSDPRVGKIVSVLRTDTSVDLKYCKVYVSILGNKEEQEETMAILKKASGFIRKRLAERANPRYTPELKFVFDDTMEYGFRIEKLIDEIKQDLDGDKNGNE